MDDGPRRAFLRALAEACGGASGVTLLLVDADDFAGVADRIGAGRAGALLAQLARRLESSTRPGDTVWRTGGDGLAALLPEAGPGEAERLFARLQASLGSEPPVAGSVGVSAGIATARRGERAVELLVRAERALAAAKAAGKGTARAAPYTH